MISKEWHFRIHIFALISMAISLPLSPFLLSSSIILMGLNFLLEGGFKTKIKRIANSKAVLAFLFLYMAHLLWLINTSDFEWGWHDIRLKLPLLVIPVLIAGTKILTMDNIKTIFLFFILAVTVNSIISTFVLFLSEEAIYNPREISLFISHIRFSLMIVISIGVLLYFIFSDKITKTKGEIYFYTANLAWLIIFLLLLKAFTGIFIFAVLFFPMLMWLKYNVKRKYFQKLIGFSTFIIVFFLLANILYPFYLYFGNREKKNTILEKYTVNGNAYIHNAKNKDKENGYYTWSNICESELLKEWNLRSDIKYNGQDRKGHPIKYTIIRYLTSKGLKKDSLGIAQLASEDIDHIENGLANHIFGKRFAIYPRIYELIWEVDRYYGGQNPSGHSLTQRIEYFKTGTSIIKENFWFGVGTGDVPKSFSKQYEKMDSDLNRDSRLRAHNQYLTFFISFGFIGFIICIVGFVFPVVFHWNKFFFLTFLVMAVLFLSMLNEDTLETHTGVSLFSYLYSILIFGYDGSRNTKTMKKMLTDFMALFDKKKKN